MHSTAVAPRMTSARRAYLIAIATGQRIPGGPAGHSCRALGWVEWQAERAEGGTITESEFARLTPQERGAVHFKFRAPRRTILTAAGRKAIGNLPT